MKGFKLILSVVCAIIAIAAAVTAIVIFRQQIAEFFTEVKIKVDTKKLKKNGEFDDYADI